KVPATILFGMIMITGTILCFAAYAFFISGGAFLSRIVELWTLIISSPFAFMSYTTPEISGLKDWGWSSWTKRLLESAFMAPGFMLFMYFIFLLINSNLFGNIIGKDGSFIERLLLIIIPAMMILTLLLKAVKLAKAGAGIFGDTIMGAINSLSGLAL